MGEQELACIRACKNEPAKLQGNLSVRSQARAYTIRIHGLFWRWVNNPDCHPQADDFHLQTAQQKKSGCDCKNLLTSNPVIRNQGVPLRKDLTITHRYSHL